eukprot:TRINITY_DN8269_c0_g1_i3.p1 TRINITY_DN8269_c0_g1~~TRINITY_DN8269_c0_g1_i3.p1  ORF type:complete len:636 (-),score=120.11 TRINITY_DN8269_c0_g1_i3:344-2251(-)
MPHMLWWINYFSFNFLRKMTSNHFLSFHSFSFRIIPCFAETNRFSGLKVEEVQEAPSGVEDCRSELLKCFLACFAGNMFHAPEDQVRYNNKWLEYATRLDTENAEPLFYSLLNAILSYDPIGWGVPYSTIVVGDDVESVLDSAAQLLIVLLDYRSPAETRANHEDQDQGTSPRTKVYYNIYRKMIAELDGQESFQKIYRKLVFLLSNPVVASNTYLPGSTHSIECFQELLVLFWKIAEINQKFLNHVLTYEDVNEFVVPCLYYLSENRKDSARVGLIHVGVFSLLMLSGERQFGVQLNKPYTANLSMNIPVFYGNHADLVILVLHKLIVDGNVRLNILFDCFLTIIVNISPYIKTLSMVASLKLMNMFEYLASPKFIYADKHNYRHVFYLVEAFNNIIQYQGDGNANLIYAIICRHKIFKELASVPLEAPVMKKRINRIEAALAASASSSASRASALALTSTQAVSPSDVTITTDAESAEKSGQSVPAPSVATEAEPVTTSEASSSSAAQPSSSASATEKFTPTLEWIESWKQKLPMQTILRLIEVIHPAIESFCSSSDDGGNELKVLELIRKTTLVGLLPVPHPILTRKYRSHEPINIWFSSFIWGVIYVRNQSPPIFFGSKIKLFVVNVVESG